MNELEKLNKKLKKVESEYEKAVEKEQVVRIARLTKKGKSLEKRIKFLKGDN